MDPHPHPTPGAAAADLGDPDDPVIRALCDAYTISADALAVTHAADRVAIETRCQQAVARLRPLQQAEEARRELCLLLFNASVGFYGRADAPEMNKAAMGGAAAAVHAVPRLTAALRYIAAQAANRPLRHCIVLLTGVDEYLDDPGTREALIHLLARGGVRLPPHLAERAEAEDPGHRMLVIATHRPRLPDELAAYVVAVPASRPGPAAIASLLEEVGATAGMDPAAAGAVRHAVPAALGRGLTEREVADTALLGLCAYNAAVDAGGDPEDATPYLARFEEKKAERIAGLPGLRYTPSSRLLPIDAIRGFRSVVRLLERMAPGMADDADRRRLDKPVGVALIGLPGCGKTTAAQILARHLERITGVPHPMLAINFAEMRSRGYGDTEQMTRQALDCATNLGRAVVLLDELEKLLGSDHSHEVTMATLSFVLTWLDRLRGDAGTNVFVVATMNTVANLPPELFREDRFDGRYVTTVPSPESRASILRLHLAARGMPPRDAGLLVETLAADDHHGLVGAELSAAVRNAVLSAEGRRRGADPTLEELRAALAEARHGCSLRQYGGLLAEIAADLSSRFAMADPDDEADVAAAVAHLQQLAAPSARRGTDRAGRSRRRLAE